MNIFFTALATIFTNFGTALKVSILPFIVGLVLSAIVFAPIATMAESTTINETGFPIGTMAIVGLLLAAIWITVMSVTAINWHRAILHNEPVGFIPNFRGLPLGAYIGRLIVLTLIMVVVGFVIAFFASSILGGLGGGGTIAAIIGGVISLGLILLIMTFWTRLGSTLPAIAVGHRLSIRDGLTQTSDIQWPILGSVICTLLFGVMVGAVSLLFVKIPVLAFIYSIATNWLSTMLGLAVLTVIYRRTGFEGAEA